MKARPDDTAAPQTGADAIAGVGTYEWFPAEDRVVWSAELVAMFGLTGPPTSEEGFTACVHPDDRVRVEAEVAAFLTTKDNYGHEFRIVRPDGSVRRIHDRGVVERDAEGRVVRLRGVAIDVTDHRVEQDAAAPPNPVGAHEGRLALFVQHAPAAMAMFDTQMRYVAVSRRFVRDYRLPPGVEIVGRSHYDVFPEVPERWRAIHARVLNGESLSAEDDPFPRRDGSTDYVRWSMSPWRAADGSVAGAFLVSDVVTPEAKARTDREAAFRRQSQAVRVAGLGFGEVDYAEGVVRLDPEARRLFGFAPDRELIKREEIHARFHPDERNALERAIAGVLDPAGDGWFEREHRVLHPDGTVRWVHARKEVSFQDGPDGKTPSHAILTVLDVTERMRLGEALRASESFAQAVLEANPDCILILDRSGRVLFVNHAVRDRYASDGSTIGEEFPALWAPGYEDAARDAFSRAGRGEAVRIDLPSGDDWFAVRLAPIDRPGPAGGAFIVVSHDITERKRGEIALREAHGTFRQLVERSPFGLYTVDETLRLTHVSRGMRDAVSTIGPLIGRDLGEVMGTIWPKDVADDIVARFRHTLATGEPYAAPTLVSERRDLGETEAYDWQIERITLPTGRPGVVCHFYDLSERQKHEERVRLLTREAVHRSKNLLALVQAVARRTAAGGHDDFVDRFSSRIAALAAGQDLLLGTTGKGVEIGQLVRAQLAHFADLIGDRITLNGDALVLTAEAGQTLGMALHELTTNAAKYGALSNEDGRVAVAWSVDHAAPKAPTLRMSWTERDGPPVAVPSRKGFGTMVVEAMVGSGLSAGVTLDYATEGLRWSMSCPLDAVSEVAAAPQPSPCAFERRKAGEAPAPVLVVEDEVLIALDLKRMLESAGYAVAGPVQSVRAAMAFLDANPCAAAVLDVNLGRETSEAIAARLRKDRVPFVVMTSYRSTQLPPAFVDAGYVGKPVRSELVLQQLASAIARGSC